MKKLFAVLAIFALALAGCWDDEDSTGNGNGNGNNSGNNDDVIGTWTGKYNTAGVVTLSIAGDYNWVMTFKDIASSSPSSFDGDWSRSGNSLTLKDYAGRKIIATITSNKLTLTIDSYFTNINRPGSIELTKSGSTGETGETTLKIKNESSKTILDVLWNNVAFGDKSSELTGTWTGTYNENTNHIAGLIELEIGVGSWSTLFKDSNGTIETASGKLGTKTGNIQYIIVPGSSYTDYYCGNASLSGNKLILNITTQAAYTSSYYFPLTKRRETYELTKAGDPFKPGTNATKNVEAGTSYIFFKIGTTAYRTQTAIIVENKENKEFTFNDYTIVVDITDSTNTAKTLGSL